MTYAANLQERLYDAGFTNIIRPIRGSDGRAIHLCGGYLTVTSAWNSSASEYQLDDRKAQSDATIREAARLLSRLHEYSVEVKTVDGSPPRHTPHALAPWDWKHSVLDLWTESATFLTAARREFLNAYSLAEALICTAPEFFQVEEAQAVLGHGDFRPANIAIAVGHRPTLFDFDLAHPDRVETEIAYAALSFSGPRWFMGSRDWTKCKLFVQEYARNAGRISIKSAQLHAAFHYVAMRALSASFKDEQVGARLQLYREIKQAYPLATA
jgi:aminoglycoside phosphotransferase (APT) family kinase protein